MLRLIPALPEPSANPVNYDAFLSRTLPWAGATRGPTRRNVTVIPFLEAPRTLPRSGATRSRAGHGGEEAAAVSDPLSEGAAKEPPSKSAPPCPQKAVSESQISLSETTGIVLPCGPAVAA